MAADAPDKIAAVSPAGFPDRWPRPSFHDVGRGAAPSAPLDDCGRRHGRDAATFAGRVEQFSRSYGCGHLHGRRLQAAGACDAPVAASALPPCDAAAIAPPAHAVPFLQPPWAVLPWPDKPRPRSVPVKIVVLRTDTTHTGAMLDLFV